MKRLIIRHALLWWKKSWEISMMATLRVGRISSFSAHACINNWNYPTIDISYRICFRTRVCVMEKIFFVIFRENFFPYRLDEVKASDSSHAKELDLES